MIFASDWRVDPDGRDTEDRKNGPVISYKLSPEEIEKIAKGAKVMTKVMTEESAKYEAGREITLQADVKKMTKKAVRQMYENGMTEDEIIAYFDDGMKKKSMLKAKVVHYLKPDEPKVEPVEVTPAEEPITFVEKETNDFWDGVKHELWGMKEAEIDKLNEDFLKILERWIGGDHSEETTAALMFYGEKVLSV